MRHYKAGKMIGMQPRFQSSFSLFDIQAKKIALETRLYRCSDWFTHLNLDVWFCSLRGQNDEQKFKNSKSNLYTSSV